VEVLACNGSCSYFLLAMELMHAGSSAATEMPAVDDAATVPHVQVCSWLAPNLFKLALMLLGCSAGVHHWCGTAIHVSHCCIKMEIREVQDKARN